MVEEQVGDTDFLGYMFNNDFELVSGEWVFQLWYGEKKLAEEKFRVIKK